MSRTRDPAHPATVVTLDRDLAVTRIVNSCVLLELRGRAVLTDPWFTERWHLHRGEGLGRSVSELPPLAAIVGSHFVPNHWDIRALAGDDGPRLSAPVVTSHPRMTRQARAAGFTDVYQLAPGDHVDLDGDVRIEALAAGAPFGLANNSYVLSVQGLRVFFGGEARDLEPIRRYAQAAPPVDVALLPVNGLHVFLGPGLVMDAPTAVEAAGLLGARTLVPIHDAHARDFPYAFVRRSSTGNDARAVAAETAPALDVVLLHTGVRWEWSSEAPMSTNYERV
jgi:L-ascorbate metabolism protein UlaG (beta-lactamase superfamily)